VASDLLTLLAGVSFVTLEESATNPHNEVDTYTGLVKSASNAYPLRLAHGMRLFSLLLQERAFALRNFQLLLPLHK
jgi:hypothetical protein